MLMRQVIAVAAVAAGLVAGGCTGDPTDKGASTSASPSASPSASYTDGERTPASVRDACTAVTKKSLARLALSGAPQRESDPNTCRWGDPIRSVRHVMSELEVTAGAVEPAGRSTATEAATRAFDRLRGFDGDRQHNRDVKHPVAVHGLGDQAKLARRWDQSPKHLAVSLMVRSRNVIVNVAMTKESATPSAYRRIEPQAELEADVLAVAEDVLRRTGWASPSPTASPSPSYAPGEIRAVRNVCHAVDTAARLVPGAPSHAIDPAHTTATGGCYWDHGGSSLVVQVEASAPRAYTGESGTDVARQLIYLDNGGRATKPPEGADEAKGDYSVDKKEGFQNAQLVARKANLVVAVEYLPSAPRPKGEVQRDLLHVADEVLAQYA